MGLKADPVWQTQASLSATLLYYTQSVHGLFSSLMAILNHCLFLISACRTATQSKGCAINTGPIKPLWYRFAFLCACMSDSRMRWQPSRLEEREGASSSLNLICNTERLISTSQAQLSCVSRKDKSQMWPAGGRAGGGGRERR